MDNTSGTSLNQVVEALNTHVSGIICLRENPQADSIAAACALYLALVKLGKNVSLACSTPVTSDLIAADKIKPAPETSGDNLAISFPYRDGSVDKVDYNIQDETFNLIITPREGFPKLDPNQVSYSFTGGVVDFLITVDASSLKSLGGLYEQNQQQFTTATVINIDRHLANSYFGKVNFVQKAATSTSELALSIIKALGVQIDREIATNLYAGLMAATNNFTSYSVNATTFETASQLLKLGAQKKAPAQSQVLRPQSPQVLRQPMYEPTPQPFPSSDSVEEEEDDFEFEQPAPPQKIAQSQPIAQQAPINPQKPPQHEVEIASTLETIEREKMVVDKPAPKDWLKPKIFRGNQSS